MVGAGSIGRRHVRCLKNCGRAVLGICEINDTLRHEVAAQYGVAEVFANLPDALERPWTAAVVATPAHTHIPIALELAKQNIHLLIEKPLATQPAGVDDLVRLVEQRELCAGVAYVWRAHPGLAAMRAMLQSGRLGRALEIVVTSGQSFPFYRPTYRQTYYADHNQGGGAIQDALTHMLNLGEWLVGPIDCVTADATHLALEGVDVEDTVHVLARHGAIPGNYALNQHQYPNETTITVVCSNGTLKFELHENRWRWMDQPTGAWHDEPWNPMRRDDWFIVQEQAFLDVLEGKATLLCTLGEGIQTFRATLAVLQSVRLPRRWIGVTSSCRSDVGKRCGK